MSKENVKKFYEALAEDKALQAKSIAIGKKYEGQKLDEAQSNLIYQEELVPLAKDAGYDFTLAELKEYGAADKESGMREVSEEELAAVAGGSPCACVLIGGGNFGGNQMICGGWGHMEGDVDGRHYFCLCAAGGGGTWR
jgi:predicted ribosomally synthesized peptide with nif11-like leader